MIVERRSPLRNGTSALIDIRSPRNTGNSYNRLREGAEGRCRCKVPAFVLLSIFLIAIHTFISVDYLYKIYSEYSSADPVSMNATKNIKEDEKLLRQDMDIPVENFEYSQSRQILLTFNGEHSQEAQNLLESIRKNAPQLLKDVIVCVSDQSSLQFVLKNRLRSFTLSNMTESGSFRTYNMNKFQARKIEAALFLLEKGMTVLYTDTDVVFLKDPMKYSPNRSKGYSVAFQLDAKGPWRVFCAGFFFADPTEDGIWLLRELLERVIKTNYTEADQDVLNGLQQDNSTSERVTRVAQSLDPCRFANGVRYFENSFPKCSKGRAVVVHNNWIVGVANKTQRLKENKLWFVKD